MNGSPMLNKTVLWMILKGTKEMVTSLPRPLLVPTNCTEIFREIYDSTVSLYIVLV